jgi:hypothetical protein
MSWWLWYLLGIITVPVVAAIVWFFMAILERGFSWRCLICGRDYHWEDPNGRWLFKELSWQWHQKVGCVIRGRKKRLAWIEQNQGWVVGWE